MAVDELISKLSTAFNKSPDSNNYKLLEVIDSEFQNIEQVIEDIKNAHFVDNATGKSLEYLAQLLNTSRLSGETDEHFRARLKTQFRRYANSTTIKELKEIVSAVLGTLTTRVAINELWDYEPASFDVWVFLQDLEAAGITVDELKEILDSIKPAGVRLTAKRFGTFEYRTAADISDPTKGYNDLANSNPDAGTYAGLL